MLIHRLDENMIAKVADFGLSRDVSSSDYYRIGHNIPLPIKWLAPEALIDRAFTTQSDVVSTTVIFSNHYSYCCFTVVIRSNLLGDIYTGTGTVSLSKWA